MNCPPAPIKGYSQIYKNAEWQFVKKQIPVTLPPNVPSFKL
jgi:hypothetical protein